MTFDELWRNNPPLKLSTTSSDSEEIRQPRSPRASAIDDLDEGELNRVGELFEEGFSSAEAMGAEAPGNLVEYGSVEFIVSFHEHDGFGADNPLEPLYLPDHAKIDVVSCKLFSYSLADEHGCSEANWVYLIALEHVDLFEQAIGRCPAVISYERSWLPGDCARTKTFFGRRDLAKGPTTCVPADVTTVEAGS